MTKHTVHCDNCGATPALPISFIIGTQVDAAGSVDSDIKYLDLCSLHMQQAASMVIDGFLDHEERERVYNSLRRINL